MLFLGGWLLDGWKGGGCSFHGRFVGHDLAVAHTKLFVFNEFYKLNVQH